jgi:hypothetical protein
VRQYHSVVIFHNVSVIEKDTTEKGAGRRRGFDGLVGAGGRTYFASADTLSSSFAITAAVGKTAQTQQQAAHPRLQSKGWSLWLLTAGAMHLYQALYSKNQTPDS